MINNNLKEDLLKKSLTMIDALYDELASNSMMEGGVRLELVKQCIQISINHSIGFNTLCAKELPIQAMILFRSQFEAVVRAYWILFLATDRQMTKLNFNWTFEEQFQSDNYPMVSEMLEQLLKEDLPAKGIIQQLSDFKKYHLKQLNSFVHTGKQSFTRNMTGFNQDMILTLMRQSNNLIVMAAQILLKHTIPDNQKFIHVLMRCYRDCFFMEEDVDPTVKARVNGYLN